GGFPVAGRKTLPCATVVVASGRGRSRPDRHDPHTNESEGVPGWGWGADVPSAGKTCGTGPGCDCSSVPSHWGRTVTRSPIVDRTRIFGRPISGPGRQGHRGLREVASVRRRGHRVATHSLRLRSIGDDAWIHTRRGEGSHPQGARLLVDRLLRRPARGPIRTFVG